MENRKNLEVKLTSLRGKLQDQEDLINREISQIYNNLKNPAPYIKSTVKELASDTDFRKDLLKIGLSSLIKYFANREKKSSATGDSLASLLLERFVRSSEGDEEPGLFQIIKSFFKKKNDQAA